MSERWQNKALADLCEFTSGLWKGEKPPFVNVGVIRNTNFTREATLDDDDIAFLDVEEKKFAKRKLQIGDLILEKSGGGPKQPVGRVILFDKTEGEFSFSNFTASLRIRDPKIIDFRFLHKFLHWQYVSGVTEGMQSHSTGIRNLDSDAYKAIRVSFPGIAEQRRIVSTLDKAFECVAIATANVEKNLSNSRELFESQRELIFERQGEDWRQMPISDLCDIKHGFAFKSQYFADVGDFVLLTPGNFYESGGFRDRGEKQKYYVGEVPDGFILKEGDLLVAMTEQAAGLLGSPVLIPDSGRFLHNQRLGLIVLRPGVRVKNAFLFHIFNTRRVRAEIHGSASGVKVRHTSPDKIGQVTVAIPATFSEQERITANLEAMEYEVQLLESIYQRKFAALNELKQSLFHQSFSGRL